MRAQVCEVNKGLLSVRRLVEAGNVVVFGSKEGDYIRSRSGHKTPLREQKGMYMVDYWVPKGGKVVPEGF